LKSQPALSGWLFFLQQKAMSGITAVHKGDFSSKSTSPAFCNRSTGELYINTPYFERLNRNQQFYVLLHELGHIALQTEDENKADAYASEIYTKKGYPLSESVKALSKVLKFNKQGDYIRLQNQFNRAAEYDLIVNHNQKIKEMKIPFSQANGEKINNWLDNIGQGLGSFGTGLNNVLTAGTGMNKGSQIYTPTVQQPAASAEMPTEEKPKKSNNNLYIGLGIALVVVVIIAIVVLRKKK
jgi:hypothetical protein